MFTIPAGELWPLVERYGPSLRWLLDVAAAVVPEEVSAMERLRAAVDRLIARRGASVAARDLKVALAGVFEGIERDLGTPPRRPQFATTRSDSSSRPSSPRSSRIGIFEWGLALAAEDWMPLFQRYHLVVAWLLDVALGTTSELTGARQRAAIARVRTALQQVRGAVLLVDPADLRCVVTLVLVALERDLGATAGRPPGRFCVPTASEVLAAGITDVLRAAFKRAEEAVAS